MGDDEQVALIFNLNRTSDGMIPSSIGIKQDQKLESNIFEGLINTSAKTHHGFEEFEEQLLGHLNVNTSKSGLDLR